MKFLNKILCVLMALHMAAAPLHAQVAPKQIDPTGSTAGQLLTSTGPSTPPAFQTSALVTWQEDEFTATASQTSFTLTESFVSGGLSVLSVDGVTFAEGTDYTISGTNLTWLDTLATLDSGDLVVIRYQTAEGIFDPISEATFSANDLTPSVSTGSRYVTANDTSIRDVTAFDDAVDGQKFEVRVADSFTRFINSATLVLQHGHDVLALDGDVWVFRKIGSNIYHLAEGVGMAAPGEVYLADATAVIGDWIAQTQATYTTVDVSDDGVPAGAKFAIITVLLSRPSGTGFWLRVRRPGETTDNGTINKAYIVPAVTAPNQEFRAPLDENGQFEARYTVSVAGGLNAGYIIGYVRY